MFPASLLGVSAGYCQTAWVDESGMIRTKMGMHNRLQMVAVLKTPCKIPSINSKSEQSALLFVPVAGVTL
jgi:hypothetical protein